MKDEKDTKKTATKGVDAAIEEMDNAPILSLEALNTADEELTHEELYIPEVKGKVLVRYLSGKERDAFDTFCSARTNGKGKINNPTGIKKKLVALSLANPDGSRMFPAKEEDKCVLKGLILDAVFDKSREMNRIGEKAVAAAKKK